MSETIKVRSTYSFSDDTTVELPEGRSWEEDVTGFHVKWGVLHVTFRDGTQFSKDLNTDLQPELSKSPDSVEVFSADGHLLDEE